MKSFEEPGRELSVGLSQPERDDLDRMLRAVNEPPVSATARLAELEDDVGRLARLVFCLDTQISQLYQLLEATEIGKVTAPNRSDLRKERGGWDD